MPAQPASPKKQRLTLAQLAAYDDILTDALVDHVSCCEEQTKVFMLTSRCRSTTGQVFERTKAHIIHREVFEKKMSLQFFRNVL